MGPPRGAVDYLVKDRPDRPVSAIRQALKFGGAGRPPERGGAAEPGRHRLLVEHARDAIFAVRPRGDHRPQPRVHASPAGFGGTLARAAVRRPDSSRRPGPRPRALQPGCRASPSRYSSCALTTGEIELEFLITPLTAGLGVTGIGRLSPSASALARLREQAEIIDRAPMAVVLTDLEHRLIYANEGVFRPLRPRPSPGDRPDRRRAAAAGRCACSARPKAARARAPGGARRRSRP